MKILGSIDLHNYDNSMGIINKKAARAIIIKDNKICLVRNNKNEFKFPGGGMDDNETIIDTLKREALEEAGMLINNDSIKEYGMFVEKWLSVKKEEDKKIYYMESYYFFCDYDLITEISPTESEKEAGFKPGFYDVNEAIEYNSKSKINSIKRELYVLELLKKERHLV